jgi:hypothetical protein
VLGIVKFAKKKRLSLRKPFEISGAFEESDRRQIAVVHEVNVTKGQIVTFGITQGGRLYVDSRGTLVRRVQGQDGFRKLRMNLFLFAIEQVERS